MGRSIQGNNHSQLPTCAGVRFWLWDPDGNCFVSVHCKIRTFGVHYSASELPQPWRPMGPPLCSIEVQKQSLTLGLSAVLPSFRHCSAPITAACCTSEVLLLPQPPQRCSPQCGHGMLGSLLLSSDVGCAEAAAVLLHHICLCLTLALTSTAVVAEGFLRREQMVLVLPCAGRQHMRGAQSTEGETDMWGSSTSFSLDRWPRHTGVQTPISMWPICGQRAWVERQL